MPGGGDPRPPGDPPGPSGRVPAMLTPVPLGPNKPNPPEWAPAPTGAPGNPPDPPQNPQMFSLTRDEVMTPAVANYDPELSAIFEALPAFMSQTAANLEQLRKNEERLIEMERSRQAEALKDALDRQRMWDAMQGQIAAMQGQHDSSHGEGMGALINALVLDLRSHDAKFSQALEAIRDQNQAFAAYRERMEEGYVQLSLQSDARLQALLDRLGGAMLQLEDRRETQAGAFMMLLDQLARQSGQPSITNVQVLQQLIDARQQNVQQLALTSNLQQNLTIAEQETDGAPPTGVAAVEMPQPVAFRLGPQTGDEAAPAMESVSKPPPQDPPRGGVRRGRTTDSRRIASSTAAADGANPNPSAAAAAAALEIEAYLRPKRASSLQVQATQESQSQAQRARSRSGFRTRDPTRDGNFILRAAAGVGAVERASKTMRSMRSGRSGGTALFPVA